MKSNMNIIADFLDNGEGANPGRSMETVPSKDTIVVVCVPLVVERIGSEIISPSGGLDDIVRVDTIHGGA